MLWEIQAIMPHPAKQDNIWIWWLMHNTVILYTLWSCHMQEALTFTQSKERTWHSKTAIPTHLRISHNNTHLRISHKRKYYFVRLCFIILLTGKYLFSNNRYPKYKIRLFSNEISQAETSISLFQSSFSEVRSAELWALSMKQENPVRYNLAFSVMIHWKGLKSPLCSKANISTSICLTKLHS